MDVVSAAMVIGVLSECHYGGAPTSGLCRRVVELGHQGCPGEHGTDGFALHTDTAPMNDAQGAMAQPVGLNDVFFHNGTHVPRRDAVQVEHVGNGNSDGRVVLWLHKSQNENPAPQAGPGRKNYAITVTART
jgi:hypothetical protein